MNWELIHGDAAEELSRLDDGRAQTCITSPPYFNLRDYGTKKQLGTEDNIASYVAALTHSLSEVKRVLRDDGTLWLNIGDTYVNKQLLGVPWRVALALQQDGWLVRSDIIWNKSNAMPESVKDRPTRSHEHIFLLTKGPKYFYDYEAVQEPVKYLRKEGDNAFRGQAALRKRGAKRDAWKDKGKKNKRDVWTIATRPSSTAHLAVFPEKLVEPCVLAGSRKGDLVLDPFAGTSTTGVVALKNGRDYLGVELNHDYLTIGSERLSEVTT